MRFKYSIIALCLCLGLVGGCSLKSGGVSSSPEPGKADQTTTSPRYKYFDFDDVPVPDDMQHQIKKSLIVETPQLKFGMSIFEGRVDAMSLVTFFQTYMPKDNWMLRSSLKSVRTVMVFEKADRNCIISITDGEFKTHLEIWIAPVTGPRPYPASAAPSPAQETPKTSGSGEKVIKLPKSGPQEKVILQ